MTKEKLINDLKEAIIQGIPAKAVDLAKQIVEEKIDPVEAIEQGLKAGISVVGEEFGNGSLFLPDLVLSAETLKAASAVLEAEIVRTGVKRSKQGKVILGTVKGDLHDIGKTIVATLLTANGFDVVDLGVNIPTEQFVEAVRREKPDVIGMSSLLTATAKELANVITELKAKGLRDSVKVVVGGGAVTQAYADKIEADGYGQNAGLGVRTIKLLLGLE
ncbi:MAG: cobalamin-dependent protein [Anaerolineales bacterium]|jgi:corrinoid protein of di/trimethylamine methyltransferase